MAFDDLTSCAKINECLLLLVVGDKRTIVSSNYNIVSACRSWKVWCEFNTQEIYTLEVFWDANVIERELLLFKVKTPKSKRGIISNGDELDVA